MHDGLKDLGAEPTVSMASPDSGRDIKSTSNLSLSETVDKLGDVMEELGVGGIVLLELRGVKVDKDGGDQ